MKTALVFSLVIAFVCAASIQTEQEEEEQEIEEIENEIEVINSNQKTQRFKKEARAVTKGSHCDYISLCNLAKMKKCEGGETLKLILPFFLLSLLLLVMVMNLSFSPFPAISSSGDILIILMYPGSKFVIQQEQGVRKQFLILDGEAILGFVKKGTKFPACAAYTEISASISCKVLSGGSDINLNATLSPGKVSYYFCFSSVSSSINSIPHRLAPNIKHSDKVKEKPVKELVCFHKSL